MCQHMPFCQNPAALPQTNSTEYARKKETPAKRLLQHSTPDAKPPMPLHKKGREAPASASATTPHPLMPCHPCPTCHTMLRWAPLQCTLTQCAASEAKCSAVQTAARSNAGLTYNVCTAIVTTPLQCQHALVGITTHRTHVPTCQTVIAAELLLAQGSALAQTRVCVLRHMAQPCTLCNLPERRPVNRWLDWIRDSHKPPWGWAYSAHRGRIHAISRYPTLKCTCRCAWEIECSSPKAHLHMAGSQTP
jgi:hypothetical protein